MLGWLILGWCVAAILLLILWFQYASHEKQIKGIAVFIRSWLTYDSFEIKFASAIKEYVENHTTNGPAFTDLKRVLQSLAQTPAAYKAAAATIERCQANAVADFAANGLHLNIYNGIITISTQPYVYRLFGADGSLLPTEANGSVYTTAEIEIALERAGVVFAFITLPDGTPIGGTVEVIRAKIG